MSGWHVINICTQTASAEAMSELGRLQDAPDPTFSYINHIKRHLDGDQPTLSAFLAEVCVWAEEQGSANDATSDACLSRIAHILRRHPKLLRGFNALLGPSQTLESVPVAEDEEVKFVVLIKGHSARIIPTSNYVGPFPPSDVDMRNIIRSKENWNAFLESNLDKQLLECISQVLQVTLDDPSLDIECRRRAHRCLRELANKSILPPSIFISTLTHENDFPSLVQGGPFADIYRGTMRETPMCFRVLRIFQEPDIDREVIYKDFCSEIILWRQLRHANILPFIGANLDLFSPQFCVITPWLQNGDLMSFLKVHPDHNKFASVCEIVEGIEYLHNFDPPIVHNGIKGANVLVKDDLVCCLADFGLSSVVESQSLGSKSSLWIASIAWMAPEIMHPSHYIIHDTRASDIYALACTIYEIYTGKPPFLDTHKRVLTIIYSVMNRERPQLPPPGEWKSEEEDIWKLVNLCWQDDPRERPEIRRIKRQLADIGLIPDAKLQTTNLVFEHPASLDNANDTTTALSVLSKCLQWVLDVDDLQSREITTFEGMIDSIDLQQKTSEPQGDLIVTLTNDSPVSNSMDDSKVRWHLSAPNSEGMLTSSSDNEEDFTSHQPHNRRSRQATPDPTLSFPNNHKDPTLHPNWRSRITRQGDRAFDLEYGSLSYLVSARRKLMSGSTISGSSRAAWRNDDTVSELETNLSSPGV